MDLPQQRFLLDQRPLELPVGATDLASVLDAVLEKDRCVLEQAGKPDRHFLIENADALDHQNTDRIRSRPQGKGEVLLVCDFFHHHIHEAGTVPVRRRFAYGLPRPKCTLRRRHRGDVRRMRAPADLGGEPALVDAVKQADTATAVQGRHQGEQGFDQVGQITMFRQRVVEVVGRGQRGFFFRHFPVPEGEVLNRVFQGIDFRIAHGSASIPANVRSIACPSRSRETDAQRRGRPHRDASASAACRKSSLCGVRSARKKRCS